MCQTMTHFFWGERMKKVVALLFVFLLGTLVARDCLAMELGIITGKEKGTFYEIGMNLQQLMQQHEVQLNVFSSNGSIENAYAVYKRPGVPLGIIQADSLAFIAKMPNNPVLRSVAKKLKMVFPLYDSEVHVLGRKDIATFDDLTGKRVAIGDEGSGTYITSKLLIEVSKVMPKETLELGTEKALARLKAGTIDAMIYSAGIPVKLFEQSVTEADNLHLIPITNKNASQYYPSMTIPSGTYGWQPTPVKTVGVKAVLISFDFRTEQCDQIGQFARILMDNLDWLRQNGHPKWKQVDLETPLKGWEQYDCVRKHLVHRKPKDPAMFNPLWDAMKEMLR